MRVMPRLGRVFKVQLRGGPLSPQQMFMLMELQDIAERQPDGAQPGELARQCGLSVPGVTAALDDLVAGGYCVRSHGEQDRRKVFVRPTEHGLRTLEAVRGSATTAMREVLNDTLKGLGEANVRALTAMLQDLDDAAEAYLDRLRS
jgi:DNA-binding MarR family transcriptional regulator